MKFKKKKYLNIRGLSIPAGEAFRPLNPLLCKWTYSVYPWRNFSLLLITSNSAMGTYIGFISRGE
ncbi:Hypothetical Protein SiL_0657 [Sulfolobus islandicus LAL14/1]|uniref:Uncharacterized protein n=1 Tax=Saccharolobus islandicus LAL14/1 TaxID=1241935 RepID=M9UC72_SACIS|nr:Hypothetical Protein SiL_0657 [Sulfolobus islandicus LAL14/1]